jgi:hypothetical protein
VKDAGKNTGGLVLVGSMRLVLAGWCLRTAIWLLERQKVEGFLNQLDVNDGLVEARYLIEIVNSAGPEKPTTPT